MLGWLRRRAASREARRAYLQGYEAGMQNPGEQHRLGGLPHEDGLVAAFNRGMDDAQAASAASGYVASVSLRDRDGYRWEITVTGPDKQGAHRRIDRAIVALFGDGEHEVRIERPASPLQEGSAQEAAGDE